MIATRAADEPAKKWIRAITSSIGDRRDPTIASRRTDERSAPTSSIATLMILACCTRPRRFVKRSDVPDGSSAGTPPTVTAANGK